MPQERHALLIGVPRYDTESICDLPVIVIDFESIQVALESSRYEVTFVNLEDPIATTRTRIRRAIRNFCRSVPDDSVAIIFLSGHGLHFKGCDYFLPSDAVLEDGEDIVEGLVPLDFAKSVDESSAATVLFFVDACREGVHLTTKGLELATWGHGKIKTENRRNWALVFGCESGQVCHSTEEYSLFANAFAEAFRSTNPAQTFQAINQSVQRKLQQLAKDHGMRPQSIRLKVESDAAPDLFDIVIADGTQPDVVPKLKLPPILSRMQQVEPDDTERRFIDMDHSGHFRVQGASGSGKTVILVHRALRLASEQPDRTGRVFTITRSLADLIESGIRLVNGSLPRNLRVSSLYEFLVECLELCESADRFRLWDERSGERSATTWDEFFRHPGRHRGVNVFASPDIRDFLHRLGFRKRDGVRPNVSKYLRDEVRLIQSAYLKNERQNYLDDKEVRKGRGFPLTVDDRKLCLRITKAWEEWLQVGQLCDTHGLSLEAAQFIFDDDYFVDLQRKMKTDFVLIDEFQDFSTLELRIVDRFLGDRKDLNNLFFAGDCKQAGFVKHHSTVRANLNFQGRSEFIHRNYRNTRQIFEAAYSLVTSYPPVSDELSEYDRPTLSDRIGPRPMAVRSTASSHVGDVLRLVASSTRPQLAILSEDERFLDSMQNALESLGHAVVRVFENDDLDKLDQMNTQPLLDGIVVSSMSCVKGWEFETVICCDLSEDSFPDLREVPESEVWRMAALAYTAFTRARTLLFVTYLDSPSMFLKEIGDQLSWCDTVDDVLEQFNIDDDSTRDRKELNSIPKIQVEEANIEFDVFLSHCSSDKPLVRELADALVDRGLRPWFDERELVPGRPWQEALERIILSTKSAAVLFGPSGSGPWEEREMRSCISEFVSRGLPVIPVLLPGAHDMPELPLFLREFTWVDMRTGLDSRALDRLQWGVSGRKPQVMGMKSKG